MKPLIGMTGRRAGMGAVAGVSHRWAGQHLDVHVSAFGDSVAAAGGLPVNLPFAVDAEAAVARLDGLVITGGQDIHPARWGGRAPVDPSADPRWVQSAPDQERDTYEEALLTAALRAGIPVLGVCRGHQLLNVALGGTLVEHLDDTDGLVVHDSPRTAPDDGDPGHAVDFVPGSLAHTLYGPRQVVNSWHHQAIDRLGHGLSVMGTTPDGVIEAVRLTDRPVVGVQWHPEWTTRATDPLFEWLVAVSASGVENRATAGGVTC